MKMVVIDGVRYDPAEADKLGIQGERVDVAIKEAAERERVTAAYGAEVKDGEVVSLLNSNAGNKTEAEDDAVSKPSRSGNSNKTAK